MLRAAGALFFGVTVVMLAGCGGGTTTIIEKTVTVEKLQSPEPSESATSAEPSEVETPAEREPALLKLSAYEHWLIEPAVYGLGVSGDLAGHGLVWSDWGSDPAQAMGEIWQKDMSGTGEYFKFPGEVRASGLETCGGHIFYSEVAINAEGLGENVPLGTPCNGEATFDPGAVTTRLENEAEVAIGD